MSDIIDKLTEHTRSMYGFFAVEGITILGMFYYATSVQFTSLDTLVEYSLGEFMVSVMVLFILVLFAFPRLRTKARYIA
ncbi:hypothetical protein E6H36_07710 [Candidatus Bathyarchaeota archaeon]|nr:MAG: hypothetical protein E6H36_07710 [Candidatus Bathyarchaeota archaeon]